MKLQIGDKALDFTTKASFFEGAERTVSWTLSEELKKGPVLLVFYPGDFTAVCTKQLCDYRDNWERFKKFKVQIVGVSTNDEETHAQFGKANHFPFPLLDDSSKEICRKYEMLMFIGMAARGFVLVDETMKVRYSFKETLPIFKRSADELEEILGRYASV